MIQIRISAELVVQMLSDGAELRGTVRVSRGLPPDVRFMEAAAEIPHGQAGAPPDLVLRFDDGSEAVTELAPMLTREDPFEGLSELEAQHRAARTRRRREQEG